MEPGCACAFVERQTLDGLKRPPAGSNSTLLIGDNVYACLLIAALCCLLCLCLCMLLLLFLLFSCPSCSDTIIGFVNSIKTVDGGTHIDGAKAALTRTSEWRRFVPAGC